MKNKLLGTIFLSLVMINATIAPAFATAEDAIHFVETDERTEVGSEKTTRNVEKYQAKTKEQRSQLSQEEQELLEAMETYLLENEDITSRTITEGMLDRAFVNLAFDFGFKRDSKIISLLTSLQNGSSELFPEEQVWFDALPNKELQTMLVYDKPTNKQIKLYSHYINNQSEQTVVIHHGYRSSVNSIMPQVKYFSELGYNIILIEARAHGLSEGDYITFGMAEGEDLNAWIDQDLAKRPEQTYYLYGVSMGGATVTMSQERPHKAVKGVIADCSYASVEQQFRDMLRMMSKLTQYIPIYNKVDWYRKEDRLLALLNENYLQPKLSMDLFKTAPEQSTSRSGVPILFAHGDADNFIYPVAKDRLFASAIGYKEELSIPGAGHGEAFLKDRETYAQRVEAFIRNVESLNVLPPVVADDSNLLENARFDEGYQGFNAWGSSLNGYDFASTPLAKNSYGEFVLQKKYRKDYVTAKQFGNGIRLFNRMNSSSGYLGQAVQVRQGEEYALNVKAQNKSQTLLAYPSMMVGVNDQIKEVRLRDRGVKSESMTFKARNNQPVTIKIGARVATRSCLDVLTTHTAISDIELINTDRTPPKNIEQVTSHTQGGSIILSGYGEANSRILLEDSQGVVLYQTDTNNYGYFELKIEKSIKPQILHLVNQDFKGNISSSEIIVFQ